MDHLQRILIFGIGGTGKTWLAREIGHMLNRPVTHLAGKDAPASRKIYESAAG